MENAVFHRASRHNMTRLIEGPFLKDRVLYGILDTSCHPHKYYVGPIENAGLPGKEWLTSSSEPVNFHRSIEDARNALKAKLARRLY